MKVRYRVVPKQNSKPAFYVNCDDKQVTIQPFKHYYIKYKKTTKNIKNKKVHWKIIDEFDKIITATPKELVYE